jgi:hypothetical protein
MGSTSRVESHVRVDCGLARKDYFDGVASERSLAEPRLQPRSNARGEARLKPRLGSLSLESDAR